MTNEFFIADYSELDKNFDAVRIEIAAVVEVLSREPPDSVLAVTDVNYTYATDIQSWINLLSLRMCGLPQTRM